MDGELGAIWPATWSEVWAPLLRHSEYGDDLAKDLFQEHVRRPSPQKPVDELDEAESVAFQAAVRRWEEAANDGTVARSELKRLHFRRPTSETKAVLFLERSFFVLDEYGDPNLSNRYFVLVQRFIERYSLRYDLRRPMTLHLTLPGIFTSLLREFTTLARSSSHLRQLLAEFEDALRDLRADQSAGRIKTCIQKQFNLIEAVGSTYPGVTSTTLGQMCNQISSWPHAIVRTALSSLYGFRSNYPGLGHGGNQASALRELDLRDLVSVTVMLCGFVPYLADRLDSGLVYTR